MVVKYFFMWAACLIVLAASAVRAQEGQNMAPEQEGQAESVVTGIADTDARQAADALLDPNLYAELESSYRNHIKLSMPEVQPPEMKSLLFTLWQHKLLVEFRQQGIRNRGVDPGESLEGVPPENRPRGIRELSLGGILYTTAENWIVWLNGQRVTPDAIPKEVMDIQVSENYIELKWFDAYSNLIFPIRLRPHQRFNLDSRIFLPGTGTSTL